MEVFPSILTNLRRRAELKQVCFIKTCTGGSARKVISSSVVATVGMMFVGCGGSDSTSGVGGNHVLGVGGNVGGAPGSSEAYSTGGATLNSRSRNAGGLSKGGTSLGGTTSTSPARDTDRGGSFAATGGLNATGGATVNGGASATSVHSTIAGGTASVAGDTSMGGAGDAKPSRGCGKTATLKNSPSSTANQNMLTIAGKSRQFLIRWPDNYDKNHPYRLILALHGATGKDTDIGPSYFGHWSLSNNSTIFVAPSADGGFWSATTDTTFVDEILKAVEDDLCIDTTRVQLEGFSQGAAMAWTLACSRPGVFRAAVGYSGGGVANPTTCKPIPYLGSLGLAEGNGQNTQTDQFAKWNGCTITTLPRAPTGSHVCSNYMGCPTAAPVRWCSYDGGHTPSPSDLGQSNSWMPKESWAFLSQF